jgi:hypothetical protein
MMSRAQCLWVAGCTPKLNVKGDNSKSGCALLPAAQCREDHDGLAIDTAGKRFLRNRPPDNNMCVPDKRRKVLLPR